MNEVFSPQDEAAFLRTTTEHAQEAAEAVGRCIARIERAFRDKRPARFLMPLSLLAAPPISLFLMALRPNPRQMWVQRWPTITFVGLYQIALHRWVQIDGMEHLPKTGPVILAGNHLNKTALDAMLIGAKILMERGRLPKFVSSSEPPGRMLRHFVRVMGSDEGVILPIQRGSTTESMIQFLRHPEAFNRRQSILGIFPAGRADRDFEKNVNKEWHTGAAVAALETDAPIVPFFIEGLPHHWGPVDLLKAVAPSLTRGKAFEFKIRFGAPVRADGAKNERNYRDITERVRQAVLHLAREADTPVLE